MVGHLPAVANLGLTHERVEGLAGSERCLVHSDSPIAALTSQKTESTRMGRYRLYVIPEELVESWLLPVQASGLDVRPINTSILGGRTYGLYQVESNDGRVMVRTLSPYYLEGATAASSNHGVLFGMSICARRSCMWPFGTVAENLADRIERIIVAHGASHFSQEQFESKEWKRDASREGSDKEPI